MPASLASWSVINPLFVDTTAIPRPPLISGISLWLEYCLKPGLLILLSSLITGSPSKYFNLISISGFTLSETLNESR